MIWATAVSVDRDTAALMAAAGAAMEGGSLGVCVWMLYEAYVLFFAICAGRMSLE